MCLCIYAYIYMYMLSCTFQRNGDASWIRWHRTASCALTASISELWRNENRKVANKKSFNIMHPINRTITDHDDRFHEYYSNPSIARTLTCKFQQKSCWTESKQRIFHDQCESFRDACAKLYRVINRGIASHSSNAKVPMYQTHSLSPGLLTECT